MDPSVESYVFVSSVCMFGLIRFNFDWIRSLKQRLVFLTTVSISSGKIKMVSAILQEHFSTLHLGPFSRNLLQICEQMTYNHFRL